ncbi:MAG: hypothetical protein CL816_05780 [Coxiellaceae bacterium]|nr:hypothetical protein [Coxiellaceae bacterium]|tara:strand:- start:2626 stop:3396 length:771 start_codon:yes stop_codon:yes gene_type:complete
MTITIFHHSLMFLLGLSFGSFYALIIDRLPLAIINNHSIKPIFIAHSRCLDCHTRLAWQSKIPVLSYLYQKGHCRYCHSHIPLQLLIIELISGLLFLGCELHYQNNTTAFFMILFGSAGLILAIIDMSYHLLPDIITLPMIWVGLIFNIMTGTSSDLNSSILAVVSGYVISASISLGFLWVRRKPGLGLGDAKCIAMIGAWTGLETLSHIIFESTALAACVMCLLVWLKRHDKNQPFPFGPFLLITSFIQLNYRYP